MAFSRLSILKHTRITALLGGALVLSLTVAGCGAGAPVSAPASFHSAPITGRAVGGINPVIGATVNAYTTGAAYGTATLRDTAYTDGNGSFTLSGDYPCPSGSYLYISAVGGNPGLGTSPGANATATATTAVIGSGATGTATFGPIGSGATATITLATGSGATATAVESGGSVALGTTAVTITAGGTLYGNVPGNAKVTFSGGGATTQATGTVNVSGGVVQSITVVTGGSGYTSNPTVAIAKVTASIAAITVTNGGSGYTNGTPTVAISTGSGATATATVNSAGVITGVTVNTGGTGYTNGTAAVSFTGQPGLTGISVGSAGSGYTATPSVSITGGGGSGATATATVSGGMVTGFTVVTTGTGYTSAPTVSATQVGVTGLTITNGGSGYTSAPNVSIIGANGGTAATNGPTGATATAVITSGAVTGLTVVNAGSGYSTTTPPTVAITPSASAANSAAVMVSAIGKCDNIFSSSSHQYSGGFVYVDELTTIAAAYALGGFSAVSGTSVLIGAPANNNATIGSATAAAGLGHAFLNAANLVNINTVGMTLSANTTTVGASGNVQAPKVPAAEINSLGNALVNCVNSSGPTSSACSTLFTAIANGGTAPTNIFSAMVLLAQHPYLGTARTNTAAVLNNYTAQTAVYTPNLGSVTTGNSGTAPSDLSIAIIYPTGTGAGTGIKGVTNPQDVALDVNDNVFVANQDFKSQNVLSFTSSGIFISATQDNSTPQTAIHIATDTAGYVWVTNNVGAGTGLERYPNASGVVSASTAIATPKPAAGLAVDRANNVWVGVNGPSKATGLPTLAKVASGTTTVTAAVDTLSSSVYAIPSIVIDPNQNIYQGGQADSGGTTPTAGYVAALENTGTAAAPAYSGTVLSSAATGQNNSPGALIYVATATPTIYSTVNINGTSSGGFVPYTVGYTTAAATSLSGPGTFITGAPYQATQEGEADGANTVFSVQTTISKNGIQYASGTTATLFGCDSSSGTCVNPVLAASGLAIDSTGSVWFASNGNGTTSATNNGTLVQYVGVAAPTWPALSLGKTGMPQ